MQDGRENVPCVVQCTPHVEKHCVMNTVNQKQITESPQRSGRTSAGGSRYIEKAGSQAKDS